MSETPLTLSSIRMGEMKVCHDGFLRTLLGSCIGVALYDTASKIGGLAHVVLPDSRGNADSPGRYADTAIPLLMKQIGELAKTREVSCEQLRLHAKIAGGANMFATQESISIGEQNSVAIEKLLAQHKIRIVAQNCGGTQGRKMTLNTATGEVTVEMVGQAKFSI